MGIIYCYTNQVNNKKYIGQTMNPTQRHSAHKSCAYNDKSPEWDSVFHRAIRKYGWENFQYEILYETEDVELLNELEKFYISYFKTQIPNGYNVLEGGLNAHYTMKESTKTKLSLIKGELTEEEVIALRQAYSNKESPKKFYDEYYSNRLTYSAFLNIWSGRRYKNIRSDLIEKGRHTKLNEKIVAAIKTDYYFNNLSYTVLSKKYKVSRSTIGDIIRQKTWKQVPILAPVSTIPESGEQGDY